MCPSACQSVHRYLLSTESMLHRTQVLEGASLLVPHVFTEHLLTIRQMQAIAGRNGEAGPGEFRAAARSGCRKAGPNSIL